MSQVVMMPEALEEKSQVPTRIYIRWMIRRDTKQVLEIEKASFEKPWINEDILHWFIDGYREWLERFGYIDA